MNRQIDTLIRLERAVIDPGIYRKLAYDEGGISCDWEKN